MTAAHPATRPPRGYPGCLLIRRITRRAVRMTAVVAVTLGVATACSDGTDGRGIAVEPTTTPTTAPATTIDSTLATWRCHPDLPADPCTAADLTTTVVDWQLAATEDARPAAVDPAVDCLVFPPADPPGSPAAASPWLATVAAPLRTRCRVFVPEPRPADPTGTAAGATFDAFLDAAGPDRPLFLVGAAEGADTLLALARARIDPDPALRARLLSITLTGGTAVLVPEGQLSGGTFANLWVCTERDQVGCVLSWHSYEAGTVPSLDLPAFAAIPAGQRAVCTHPAGLDGSRGQLRAATFPTQNPPGPSVPGLPEVTTPFVTLPEYFVAECVNFGSGVWYLRVEPGIDPDDLRRPGPLTDPDQDAAHLGTRNLDIALASGDLTFLLERQLAAWTPQTDTG